jgi:hypothetical protein
MTSAMQAMLNPKQSQIIEANQFIKMTDRNLPPLQNGDEMIRIEKKIFYQEGKVDMVNHSQIVKESKTQLQTYNQEHFDTSVNQGVESPPVIEKDLSIKDLSHA